MPFYRCAGCGSCKRVCDCTYEAERVRREVELDNQFLVEQCAMHDSRTIVAVDFKDVSLNNQRHFINVLKGNFPGTVELIDGPDPEFDLGTGYDSSTSYTVHLWLGLTKPDGSRERYYVWNGSHLTLQLSTLEWIEPLVSVDALR